MLLREIDHVVAGDDEPHASTCRLVLRGSPSGGEVQNCEGSAITGSDDWYAGWFDGLPAALSVPGGSPGEDLELVLD